MIFFSKEKPIFYKFFFARVAEVLAEIIGLESERFTGAIRSHRVPGACDCWGLELKKIHSLWKNNFFFLLREKIFAFEFE